MLWTPQHSNLPPPLGYECAWADLKANWLPKEWPATCPGTTPEKVVGYQFTGDAFKMDGVYDELGRKVQLDINLFRKSFMASIKDPMTSPGAPDPVVLPPAPVSDAGKYAVNVKLLNIRKGPGTSYDLAGEPIGQYTVVDVLEIKGDWARIPTGSLTSAWCYLPYLTTTLPVDPAPVVVAPVKYKVTAWLLNIRTGPGTQFAFAGLPLLKGSTVEVTMTLGDWALLTTGAWCFLGYLARLP